MFKIHERDLRGKTKTGWLDSAHTFSFGSFQDPDRMGFRSLRVINEDRVIPGAGFGAHPHNNMEIISIVLDGALEHKDSMGNGSTIRPNEIQIMSAGTGVTHSEFNGSEDNPVHFLQIWIEPEKRGIEPAYAQIPINDNAAKDGFTLIGSRGGGDNIVTIHQDVWLYRAKPQEGKTLTYNFKDGRYGFLQIVSGEIEIEGEYLKSGDGLQMSDIRSLTLTAKTAADVLLFDLA